MVCNHNLRGSGAQAGMDSQVFGQCGQWSKAFFKRKGVGQQETGKCKLSINTKKFCSISINKVKNC